MAQSIDSNACMQIEGAALCVNVWRVGFGEGPSTAAGGCSEGVWEGDSSSSSCKSTCSSHVQQLPGYRHSKEFVWLLKEQMHGQLLMHALQHLIPASRSRLLGVDGKGRLQLHVGETRRNCVETSLQHPSTHLPPCPGTPCCSCHTACCPRHAQTPHQQDGHRSAGHTVPLPALLSWWHLLLGHLQEEQRVLLLQRGCAGLTCCCWC
jgi:hypothetical protein